ncbi:MAG: SDR family oxidoreductase [Lachnospiraceae bacterium]|nr:SDR family oxidoreductase [Lachnospiraceae bacterium]
MEFNGVKDKVVIVTGASRGIGRAMAEVFGENGMKVVCAARSEEQGKEVVASIESKGGDAIFVKTDCSKATEIKALVDKTVEHYGRLDGVVSNAGIGMGGTPLHEYEVEDYEKVFSLNSEGVFAGMKYGTEAILKSKSEGGFLINVASVAGLMPQSGQALYTATKFGVVGMTRAAAMDYAKYGITVNAICPGYTKTSIFGDAGDAAMDFFANDCPAGRMGDPRECAYLGLFLASDMARYITGAAIPVDGALSAGHKSVTTWKHPEILTGEGLSSESTIAAIMEDPKGLEIVRKFLPGFEENEQAKQAYGMTFKTLAPMLGLPEDVVGSMLSELDQL